MNTPRITLYYAPQTRATGTRIILEELGAPYDLHLLDIHAEHDPGPSSRSVYGTFDEMLSTLEQVMTPGPYILGERMIVADIFWGVAAQWTMMFGLVPEKPIFREFRQRIVSRPAAVEIQAADEKLADEQATARGQ